MSGISVSFGGHIQMVCRHEEIDGGESNVIEGN